MDTFRLLIVRKSYLPIQILQIVNNDIVRAAQCQNFNKLPIKGCTIEEGTQPTREESDRAFYDARSKMEFIESVYR